jgi:hypothetical protein
LAQQQLTKNPTSQMKSMINQTSQKYIVLKKKTTMGLNNILIYEGDKDPKIHWFVCEKLWDAVDITDEYKQMAQFCVYLRHRDLTWFMNFKIKIDQN